MKRLPRPSRGPLEADQCAGRTNGCNLPVSHAQCQAEQNPIRPVPPLALHSFIQLAHSLLSSQPVSFSSVGTKSVPSAPLGRSKSPRRSVTRPRLSFCVCAVERRWAVFTKHTCLHIKGRQTVLINLCEIHRCRDTLPLEEEAEPELFKLINDELKRFSGAFCGQG